MYWLSQNVLINKWFP
jgi:hypothetical protein